MRTKPRTMRNLRDLKVEDQTHNVVFPSQQHPDSACVFRSTRDDKPFHFTLKVQSFSFLKAALAKSQRHRYESHSFDVGGYKW
ncbi:MATH domain-containing protein [Cucumis melo var. makuwa]|uniref:MATH domain-containing protein n=1 Tax=Cucumis melo var. makuwa TaxID=1194695 RepID=A0A5A7U4R5_CUCMM|nr:MATH domain-containing protein [Cucumis melo var. makuwa]TYJ98188.1 MATH domain-containing protein [Cucumis melo var. makuwa]